MSDTPHSPASLHVDPPRLPSLPRRSRAAGLALLLAVLPFGAWGACATEVIDPNSGAAAWLWVSTWGLGLVGSGLGFVSWRRLRRADPFELSGRRMSLAAGIVGLLAPVATFLLALATVNITFSRGRALRRGGKARTPTTTTRPGWMTPLAGLDASEGAAGPARAAEGWRRNAETEAASVASFAHLGCELLALGAPAYLVDEALQAGRDEVEHARLCYGVAAALAGRAAGPAPFPAALLPRDEELTLASLAADSLVEGCLYEGASARVAAALAERCELPAVRAVLATLAGDEQRHGEHGWDVVAWCREEGGAAVEEALRSALAGLDLDASRPPTDDDGLERYGLAGPSLWRACLEETHAEVVARLGLHEERRAA